MTRELEVAGDPEWEALARPVSRGECHSQPELGREVGQNTEWGKAASSAQRDGAAEGREAVERSNYPVSSLSSRDTPNSILAVWISVLLGEVAFTERWVRKARS